jgi:hypothetical protein
MRSPLVLIVLVGLVPLTIFALIVTGGGLGLVRWQPPVILTIQFGTPNGGNGVTALSTSATGIYAAGYVSDAYVSSARLINESLFVSRYDFNGHQIWTQRFADFELPNVSGIAAGTDGVYVDGSLNRSSFIRKFDLNGNQAWVQFFDSPGLSAPEPMGIAVGSNAVFAAGEGSSRINGVSPILLREFDLQGNPIWTNTLGNSTGKFVSVYSDKTGVYVTGEFLGPNQYNPFVREYGLNGTLLWNRMLNPSPEFPCSCLMSGISGDDTGIVIAGYYAAPPLRGDAFIQKYGLNGNQLWTIRISSPNYAGLDSPGLSVNPSGIYFSSVTGNGATFVMKYDGNGNSVWSFQVQTLEHPFSSSLPISAGNNGVFVGGAVSTDRGADAYVTEFSQSSSLILFGITPPFSFIVLAAMLAIGATSVFLFRRIRRRRVRSRRVGPLDRSLQDRD